MSRAASLVMPDLPPDLSHDNSFVRELAESFGMGGDVGEPAVCAPHSPLRPQCAAPASAAAIVSGCSCSGCATAAQVTMSPPWGSYCLEIESPSVHAREQGPEGAPKYLVSNLKFYNVKVVLKDRRSQLLATQPLRLRATLLYANGQPLRELKNDEPALLGSSGELELVGGRTTFRLKMGKDIISSRHDERLFRVRIEPCDPELAKLHPNLTAVTEPMRSMTKLPSARVP